MKEGFPQPSAFVDMMHGGSINCAEWLLVPWNVIDKFSYNKFIRTNIAKMRLIKFPPIVIDIFYLFV
jgi:hypothetical protein